MDWANACNMLFRKAFKSQAKKVVIIGSDCPQLDRTIIEKAFASLDDTDFVIGPSTDGGYYLLGMKEYAPWVFEGIEWSTATVRQRTLEKILAAGKQYSLLPELSDIDTEADWNRYQHQQ